MFYVLLNNNKQEHIPFVLPKSYWQTKKVQYVIMHSDITYVWDQLDRSVRGLTSC